MNVMMVNPSNTDRPCFKMHYSDQVKLVGGLQTVGN